MDKKKIKELLNSLVMKDMSFQEKCSKANKKVSGTSDELALLKIIDDMEANDNEISIQEIENSLKIIAQVLINIDYNGHIQKAQNNATINHDVMPFFIKQVLFYVICQAKLSNAIAKRNWGVYISEQMKINGVCVSKNILSDLEYTPEDYIETVKYPIPKNPCGYKGQKSKELGFAIKNIVYQSGKSSCVIDVFGGSGSAIASVYKRRKSNYYYNEINRAVFNYVKTISSSKYKEILVAIRELQYDITRNSTSFSEYYNIDVKMVINKYLQSKLSTTAKDKEIKIFEIMNYISVELDSLDIKEMLSTYCQDISYVVNSEHFFDNLRYNNRFALLIDKKILPKKFSKSFSFEELKKYIKMHTFDECEELLYLLRFQQVYSNKYEALNIEILDNEGCKKKVSYMSWRKSLMLYKTLVYFAYFYNLRNTSGEINQETEVIYAVGEIFLRFFATRENIISSEIINNKKNGINFIEYDFKTEILDFHKNMTRVECHNKSFDEIFEQFNNKTALFYLDPPYVGTVDYKDEANGVDNFNYKILMPEIIDLLIKMRQKFIYSMRAVISKEKLEGIVYKEIANIVKGNQEIKEYVYKEFEKSKNQLYVLVIREKSQKIESLIENCDIIEIMITNFKITGFSDENYYYDVYLYEEYLDLIDKHMHTNLDALEKFVTNSKK